MSGVYTAVAIHFSHTPKHTQLFSRLPCSGAVDIELKSSRGSGLHATLKIPTKNCSRDSPGLVGVVISPENRPAGRLLRISESLLRIVGICLFPSLSNTGFIHRGRCARDNCLIDGMPAVRLKLAQSHTALACWGRRPPSGSTKLAYNTATAVAAVPNVHPFLGVACSEVIFHLLRRAP